MYVGQTTQDPEIRLRAHRGSSFRKTSQEYYTDKSVWIREHGKSNIGFFILESNPRDGLDQAERRWIEKLGTMRPQGVNMATGGYAGAGRPGELNPSCKLSEAQVKEIIDKIANDPTCTSYSLARDYNVTKTLILKIDHGELWGDIPRPKGTRVLSKRNPKRHLTPYQRSEIMRLAAMGETTSKIASAVGASWGTVNRIRKGY